MESKFQEGNNHLCWLKRLNRRRKSGNGLNIVVLPQNPPWQVTHHPSFVGYDPSRVPAYVLKRRHDSLVLVRPPNDMIMLHRIHPKSEVSSIKKNPRRFPSTHIWVLPIVIFIRPPQNELSDVSKNSSLQTQRDKFISAHKYHTKNYTFTIHLKNWQRKNSNFYLFLNLTNEQDTQSLFSWREMVKRELAKRAVEERCPISLIWCA